VSKDWQVYAKHVRDTIAKINRIRERGDLTTDEVLYDATLRNLQTLSEATQRIPDTVKQRFPEIPWKEISGFRNILVHTTWAISTRRLSDWLSRNISRRLTPA
jgi:uncharacterized protein with HEPN domain